METVFGAMSPQMLRIVFASRDSQEQGFEMILGMLTQTGVTSVLVRREPRGPEWGEDTEELKPAEYAESVMRTILGQFGLPYLLGGDNDASTTG